MSRPPKNWATRAAKTIMERCSVLGQISEEPGRLTRTFHSPAMQAANGQVGVWMREAGLAVSEDAAFNLSGRWRNPAPEARTLLLGSHLDTVRDAGRYDGPLGVLCALAVAEQLKAQDVALPFHLEVIGFSDEEGTRYQTTYLGSRALAGTLTPQDLASIEEKGIERARREPASLLAYAEVHIEQGPVLEQANLALGVVEGIAGQSRLRAIFHGQAGHAGTTPMPLRRDALAGAAELILAVEQAGVIATVGQIVASPGASNVIPGEVTLSVDVRDLRDDLRHAAVRNLHARASEIARKRHLQLHWLPVQECASVHCDPRLSALFTEAIAAQQAAPVLHLASGAGHDAVALSAVCPVAMLFVRCKKGLSHHPDEAVKTADVAQAVLALHDFVLRLAAAHS